MFGRVAAWGVAACLGIWPAASGIESCTFVEANVAVDAVTIPLRHDEAETEAEAASEMAFRIPDRMDGDGQQRTNMAAFDPTDPKIAAWAMPEPFGLAATPVAGGDVLAKWNAVKAAIRSDRKTLARCRQESGQCPNAARKFLAVIAEGRGLDGRSRVGVINRAVNLAIRPMSDIAQWGVPDRWSPPLETFTTGRGDCEDYAIAKYVALTEAGIAPGDIKLVIVPPPAKTTPWSRWRLDGEWIILDNRWLTLVEDTDMRQAVARFELDEAGVQKFEPAAVADTRRMAAPASIDF